MKNRGLGKTKTIDIRISNALKDALESFCNKNLQTTSETITHAIKHFVGFGQINPPKRKIGKIAPDKIKIGRLQIRIYPRLKNEFYKFCDSNGIKNKSIALTEAIRLYIGSIPDTISNRKRAGY
jgi:metal-responsive CopG/Arc/MetJ family transcriptional regulator